MDIAKRRKERPQRLFGDEGREATDENLGERNAYGTTVKVKSILTVVL